MPQLAVETFASQIFWILVGFFVIYTFMSAIVTPNIESTLEKREKHINSIVQNSQKLNTDAKKVEKVAIDSLERTTADLAESESRLISSLRKQSIDEKEALYKVFAQESKAGAKSLSASSESCFNDISVEIDDIVNVAMQKINSAGNHNRVKK